jgi:DegV family protein with EDD domain
MSAARVAVITDSTSYLPVEVVRERGIAVVPLQVVIGGRSYDEGADASSGTVAEALRTWQPVTTSRPGPAAFAAAYASAAEAGSTGVVSVHLSAQMSGTVESARLAAKESPVPVEVVDSESLGMGLGYAVLSASSVAAAGGTIDEVAEAARKRAAASHAVFYVDTLEHLRRGGRIGAASALLGSALAIKPILAVRGGRIVPVEKVRTSSRAVARIEAMVLEQVAKGGHVVDIAVHHLDAPARAEQIAGELHTLVPGSPKVLVVELGAVVGAHVGPGTVAIAVSPRPGEPLPESPSPREVAGS